MNKIKVKLLNITPEAIVNQAVAMPYGSEPSFELTKRVICMKKHLSCAEHVVMNFMIEGSSRLELQEHMRHRMASPTVKSSRFTLNKDLIGYADADDYSDLFVMPDLSALNSEQQELMKSAYDAVYPRVMTALTILKESKIPNDYVKYILPEGFKTGFVWTINLRSLFNFLDLRNDEKAHFEIRAIANMIIEQLKNSSEGNYAYLLWEAYSKNKLDKQILLLASKMLEMAADEFSNHGCNDLSDDVIGLMFDAPKLCKEIREWNNDDDSDWPRRAESIGDSSLMSFLSNKMKRYAESL